MAGKGLDPNQTIKQILSVNCQAHLVGNAANMTLGDLWRLGGWGRNGEPPVNVHPVLKRFTMEEIQSIASAFECHAAANGVDFKYKGTNYSCCCCTVCAVSVPPNTNR